MSNTLKRRWALAAICSVLLLLAGAALDSRMAGLAAALGTVSTLLVVAAPMLTEDA